MDNQCMDRCHRIGQVRDVKVYRMISKGTVEESIWQKALQKRVLDQVVIQDGNFIEPQNAAAIKPKKPKRKVQHGGVDWAELANSVLEERSGLTNLEKGDERAAMVGDDYVNAEMVEADMEDEKALELAMKEIETLDDVDFKDEGCVEGGGLSDREPDSENKKEGYRPEIEQLVSSIKCEQLETGEPADESGIGKIEIGEPAGEARSGKVEIREPVGEAGSGEIEIGHIDDYIVEYIQTNEFVS
ncbi:Helicase SWR1 [Smittium mucronatum]|uniref:Helicase SWR1 n=1 Tax=Smittium mucronatum TaxID=133383 RepID=A0A1R0H2F5_9FUNG|nr:Helicase SWR1 [Smittium mucronatum]